MYRLLGIWVGGFDLFYGIKYLLCSDIDLPHGSGIWVYADLCKLRQLVAAHYFLFTQVLTHLIKFRTANI